MISKQSIENMNSKAGCDALMLVGGFITITLLLVPYASNGFWFDDALNSQVYFGLHRLHGGIGELVDFSYRVTMHWLLHEGRPMFGFLFGYSGFYFFNDLFSLRLAQTVSVVFNVALYGYMLWLLGAKIRFLVVWAILLVGLFQISGQGLDPVAGFAFHYQVLGIQLTIVMILFIKWQLNANPKYLYSALILWLLFMLFYEINSIFIPIALAIMFINGDQYKKLPGFLLISTACLYLALNFYISIHANGGYVGSAFGLPSKMVLAYLKQLSATFPFTSYLAIIHNSYPIGSLVKETMGSALAWAVFICSLIIFATFTSVKSSANTLRSEAFLISLGMFLLPAIFPAISLRYQNEVNWGLGTLPVYYQYFGLSFFAAYAMTFIPTSGSLRFVVPILISIYLALNVTINSSMVKILDKVWREPRDAFAVQAQSGLFSQVLDGDIIKTKDVAHYINSNLIFQWSGKRVYVPTDDHYWFSEAPNKTAKTFELSRSTVDHRYHLFSDDDQIPENYNATLAEGIQFAVKPNYPSFIKSVIGMSGYETAGRWTEAKNVIFIFNKNIPATFTLELDLAGAFGPNAGKEIQIKTGGWRGQFIVDVNPRLYKILVKTKSPTDRIEFIIPEPISPNELGGINDPRKLGIMFKRLSIITN